MKIVFVNSMYTPHEVGGAERAVRVIAESLVAAGGEAVVICLAPDGVRRTQDVNGVRVHYVPLANIGFLHGRPLVSKWRRVLWHLIDAYNPLMGSRVARILEDERPDVVETNNLQGFSVAVWLAARRLDLPVVQVLHDYYLVCPSATMYRSGHNCARQCGGCAKVSAVRRKHSNLPRVVSAVSHRTLARTTDAGMFAAVRHKSVGPTAIRLVNHTGSTPRRRHEAGAELMVGYLGRIEPIKGVELLLEAVASIDKQPVRLLVAGTGPLDYADSLRKRFESPAVEFLGMVDPLALFGRIDVLFVPSLWDEPLTRVIAEAYACGIPVAVSKMGGMPEIVDDGVTGYVFAPNDVGAIRALLLKLVATSLPEPNQAKACVARSQEFAVETVFRRHQSLWQQALATPSIAAPCSPHR